ncbi:hypothetical protein QAD02_021380 [Eretmocerus hayati]|uniref:Uncharacterized protein n=1 Tax=Eretmocerus hayati TaxID=131215 RepID=A0ACC2PT92_9HYME|nr:hypothetical protein QAD02_021380 [Eretmocerus hayati]
MFCRSNEKSVAIEERRVSISDHRETIEVQAKYASVDEAWQEVRASTINKSWKKLLPGKIQDITEPPLSDVIEDVTLLARAVGGGGFSDITEDEVSALVNSEREGLSVEEIGGILNQPDDPEEFAEATDPVLSSKSIVKIMKLLEEAIDEAIEHGPILTRSLEFKYDCQMISLMVSQELPEKMNTESGGSEALRQLIWNYERSLIDISYGRTLAILLWFCLYE